MKFDKELVLKNKFWFLLVVTLPLSLGALFILATSVSGEINSNRAKIEKALKEFTAAGDIKTDEEIKKVTREAEIEEGKKNLIWKEEFAKQEGLFLWPDQVEKEFNFKSGLFAQKIQITKAEAGGPPAKNEERLIHGTVTRQEGDALVVLGADKKEYRFHQAKNVIIAGGDYVFGTIPVNTAVEVTFHRGKYFMEPLTEKELGVYRRFEVYTSQIEPLLALVEPMNEKGEGIVQLPGYWFMKDCKLPSSQQLFLNYLENGWEDAQEFSEEAWLAQEDIWVQQELYRLIRAANKSVSEFQGKGGEERTRFTLSRTPSGTWTCNGTAPKS